MNGSIRVGNLFGIPFYVNPSWFLSWLGDLWSGEFPRGFNSQDWAVHYP
jgi:hypothetical protein